jgi:hypothetical protein
MEIVFEDTPPKNTIPHTHSRQHDLSPLNDTFERKQGLKMDKYFIDNIVQMYEGGVAVKELAARNFCCEKTIFNYINRYCFQNFRDIKMDNKIRRLNGKVLRQYLRSKNKYNKNRNPNFNV